ncbi:hypothetical protein [Corallococcus sp. CA041A]|uniref:hypothetical protein n=1 Tax=Corallococcus sp. CA041A TaxID=2316727 RepID=UPI0011C3D795|nr:hypothetical protein [Corallococcus sp. CA041A]
MASFQEFRRLSQKYKIDINIRTLSQNFNSFFQNEELDIANTTQISDITHSHPPAISPEVFDLRNKDCAPHLAEALSALGCNEELNNTDLPYIVGLELDQGQNKVSLASNPDLVEMGDGSIHGPLDIQANFHHISTPKDFSTTISQEDFINNPEASFTATLRSLLPEISPRRDFILHDKFIDSLVSSTLLTENLTLTRLMRASSAIICQEELSLNLSTRAIRVSAAGDAKQVKRTHDDAAAWRTTITKNGAGWRLHYWIIPKAGDKKETVEFVSILRESDPVSISE